MNCKCKYFKMVDGKLVCSQCGKPPHSQSQIEDKSEPMPENKSEPESRAKKRK